MEIIGPERKSDPVKTIEEYINSDEADRNSAI